MNTDQPSYSDRIQRRSAWFSQISVGPWNVENMQKSFIAFDVETTGLDPIKDRIIELGAVLFVDGIPVKTFCSLINTGVAVSPGAYAVNHISAEMVSSAPTEDVIYPQFLDFLGPALNGELIMCAHNARFDFNFLQNTFIRLGYQANIEYVDTLNLARRCIHGLSNYKQSTLADYFGLPRNNDHRAAADAETCGKIMWELLGRSDELISEELYRETKNEWYLHANTYWQKGEACRKNGQLDEAIALYDKAKAYAGAPSLFFESYAKVYRKLKDYEAEISILSEGIEKHPLNESLAQRRERAEGLLRNQRERAEIEEEKAIARAQKQEARRIAAELAAAKPKRPSPKPVIQMDDAGTVIAEFESVSSASKELGINPKSIRDAANGVQKHAGGYRWVYKTADAVETS